MAWQHDELIAFDDMWGSQQKCMTNISGGYGIVIGCYVDHLPDVYPKVRENMGARAMVQAMRDDLAERD
eukprot:9475073-Lingulodinium_polyedra.AAC.1